MDNILDEICIERIKDLIKDQTNLSKNEDPLKTYTSIDNQVNTEEVYNTFNFVNRIIYIDNDIDEEKAKEIFEAICFWNKIDENIPVKKRKKIKIFINTNGGNLYSAFTIITAIKLSKTPVYTYNIGTAFSCGFFILISGDKRFGTPYASYLFHEGACTNSGDAHKFLQWANDYKAMLERIKQITLGNTKISLAQYEEHKKDDWYFDSKTAIEYGIIDEIVRDFNFMQEENGTNDE